MHYIEALALTCLPARRSIPVVPDPGKDRQLSRRRLLAATGFGAACTLVGTGCGTGTSGHHGDGPNAITVTDQRGVKVTFDHPVRRVVTLPVPAASMLVAVDRGAEHLVGMQRSSWVAAREGILSRMFPAVVKVPHDVADQSFTPNVESILALHPDVVVQWADHGAGIVDELVNAGLTVIGLDYGTQHDLETWVGLFATALGKPERGTAIVRRMHSRLAAVKARPHGPAGPRPKIVYLRYADGLKVAGRSSYNDFYIKLVGGRNPASEDRSYPGTGSGAAVDVEQVLAWDPDIVLLSNFDQAMPEDVYRNRIWKDVSAVRSRRVYKIPLGGYRWDPPSQESPLMWQWLSAIAYPHGKAVDLRGEILGYYRFLYGHEPSSAEIDAMLWTHANDGSAAYRQFSA